jgi:hypothetical protein
LAGRKRVETTSTPAAEKEFLRYQILEKKEEWINFHESMIISNETVNRN